MKSKNAVKSAIPNYEKLKNNKKIVQKCKIKNTQQSLINFSSKNTNANSYKSNKFQPLNIISNNLKKHDATISNLEKNISNSLIFDQKIHLVAIFKDYLIWDDLSEFLKRFYLTNESIQIIPKISECYNYYSIITPVYFGLEGLIVVIMNNWVRVRIKILEHKIEVQENSENTINDKISKNSDENFEIILKDDLLSTWKSKSQSNIWANSKNTIDLIKYDFENNEKNKKDKNKNNNKKHKNKISISFSELIDELSSHYSTIYQEKKAKTKRVLSKRNREKNCYSMINKMIILPDNNKYNNLNNKVHKLTKTNLMNKNQQIKNEIFTSSRLVTIPKNFGKNFKSLKISKENKVKKNIYKKINSGSIFKSKTIINHVISNNAIIENRFRVIASNSLKKPIEYNSSANSSCRAQVLKKNNDINNNIKLNKINIKNIDQKNVKRINKVLNIKSESRNSIKIKKVYFSRNISKIIKQNSSNINPVKQKEKRKNKGKEENSLDNKSLTVRYIHTNTNSMNNAKNFIQLVKSSNKKNKSRNHNSKLLLSNINNKINFRRFNISSKFTKDNNIKSASINYFQKLNVVNIKNIISKNHSPNFKNHTIGNSKTKLKKKNLMAKSKEDHSYKNKKNKKTAIGKNSRNVSNFIYLSNSNNTNFNNNSIQPLKNSKLIKLFFTNKTMSNNNIENNSANVSISSRQVNSKKLNLNIKYNFNKQNKYRKLLLFPKKSVNKAFDNKKKDEKK